MSNQYQPLQDPRYYQQAPPQQQQGYYQQPPQGYYQPPQQQGYYQPPQQGYQQPQQPQQQAYGSAPTKAYSSNSGSDGSRFSGSEYRDLLWAILFVIQLVGVLVISIYMFHLYHNDLANDDSNNNNSCKNDPNCHEVTVKINARFWSMIAICLALGTALCVFWLYMIKNHTKAVIWFSLLFGIGMLALAAVFFFAAGQVAGGVICLIFLAIHALYVYLIRNRIAFAAAMLDIIVSVVNAFPAMIGYSFGSIFVQAGWIIIFSMGAASIFYALDQKESGSKGIVYFFLVLSFFWTSQVVKNVVHVTIAGTMASWYFLYPNNVPENPTNKSFKRAVTTSFGSICLGSLIVAIIKTLRTMVQQARDSENGFVRCFVECILSCLERLIEYFNIYAFTQVAIYGKSYCEAAKATFQLLSGRGLDAVINDDIISGVLAMASFIGGVLVGVFGGLIAYYIVKPSGWAFFILAGFLIGFGMVLCVMTVIESCVVTLFVCFAEDPEALQQTKPVEYQQLTSAMAQFYPSVSQAFVRV